MDVVVAPMQARHFGGFHECLDAVCREERHLAFIEAPPRQEVETFLRDLMARGCPQFVALDDERVVGWIDINVNTLPGFTHSGRLGMGLLPAYRGRGLGRRLLESALAAAKLIGLKRIELQVFASNGPAIKLYERAGFVHEGRRDRARILHDIPDDIIDMAYHFS
ncbi:MAG: GNAT family N-acetyltransferase [Bacteroidetes bacterium]|jgi:ribosomal protein S18 acetylase RimI-like enzyme|nr:GNAT family N-acetyltransferase [Bacteroidota bacterium]